MNRRTILDTAQELHIVAALILHHGSQMIREAINKKPIVFTKHALERIRERGSRKEDVEKAIHSGEREKAQRGFFQFRLNLEFGRDWDGRTYGIQQVAPIVAEEPNRLVVVTVYVFYF